MADAATLHAADVETPALDGFARYLTLWVALCIVAGIVLGQLLPGLFHDRRHGRDRAGQPAGRGAGLADDRADAAARSTSRALRRGGRHWRGIGVTLFVNWVVKPFSMALLGWLFIGWLFRPCLPADQIDSYIAGLIMLAAAPCTAMVFVWSQPDRGRAALHAQPGGAQRRHHGGGVRADRGAAAGPVVDHRAVGRRCCCRSCSTSWCR